MSKSVILITITGILWVATGSALAQPSNAGRAPTGGVGPSAANGLFMAIPSVSALNRPIAVPVGRTPDLVAAPPGLAVAASNFAATASGRSGAAPGRSGAAPGLSGAAPGLADKNPGQEKSAKDSGSLRSAQEASLSFDPQRQQLRDVPICN